MSTSVFNLIGTSSIVAILKLDRLVELGCELGQRYRLARPVELDA